MCCSYQAYQHCGYIQVWFVGVAMVCCLYVCNLTNFQSFVEISYVLHIKLTDIEYLQTRAGEIKIEKSSKGNRLRYNFGNLKNQHNWTHRAFPRRYGAVDVGVMRIVAFCRV